MTTTEAPPAKQLTKKEAAEAEAEAKLGKLLAVLGTMPLGPVLPGRGDKPRTGDDDMAGHRKGGQTNWTSVAHRGALAAVNARRADDRHVCVYELGDDAWHAIVIDGWGRLVERCTPELGCHFDDARLK